MTDDQAGRPGRFDARVAQWRPVTSAEAETPTSLWGGAGRKP